MAGVYNRKLFRQSSARDELRKMGGIMASSEELMMEALRTAAQAPRPSALGPMAMPAPQPAIPQQPMMPMQQPMMQQPMAAPMAQPMDMGMQQPVMPMQQPMMQPQQPMMPMQQPTAEPAYMPPGMPASAQQPVGFKDGGNVSADEARKMALLAAAGAGGFVPDLSIGGVDVSAPAGTVVEAPAVDIDEDIVATAKDLEMRLEDEPPYAVANKILAKAAEKGAEVTGDAQFDLAKIYEQMTGDAAAYEKNIDELNRGIIGAAIASGTSARATENIAKGLLVGLEGTKSTEERRAGDARALQLAALQGLVKGSGALGGGTEMSPQETYIDSVREAANTIMQAGLAGSYEEAMLMAEEQLRPKFEEAGILAPTAPAPPSGDLTAEQQAVLSEARVAIEQGRDPAVISDRLRQMGIDPGLL